MKLLPILLAFLFLAGAMAPGIASSQTEDEVILRVAVQDDLKGTNPFSTAGDYWTDLMTRWLYDTPMFYDEIYINRSWNYIPLPYIAIGSANVSGKADSWDDCAIGNFDYSPESSW
ncbi:MAG: hypothetical protein KKD98_09645, partial [Candidatus Thermoplasmatota archaeon]|nr:hypothetical protein [Candidatus Thermoplasmatota archaeon]